jgi:hypothetical protein
MLHKMRRQNIDMVCKRIGDAIAVRSKIGTQQKAETPSDSIAFELYGKTPAGEELLLATIHQAKDTSISFIDAKQYPYLKMKMFARDEQDLTPFQLHHWKLEGTFLPEGAIAPNLKFIFKDTLELGETLNLSIAFQNVRCRLH